ncbi:MAG: IS21 family transposase, partial [Clostridia bacterium]|nr:IS21 family transposase [Clostridia bacterium]
GLVGFIRRNVLVPIPKVKSIEVLNDDLLKKCIEYRKHKIKGRDLTVGEMFTLEQTFFTHMPNYVYDTSKQNLVDVDEFSLIRFDTVQYSVPYQYVGKCVTVKGYGNHVEVLYKGTTIAGYTRSYKKSSVHYKLEHYIDIIERRPRSAYNAKPVKQCLSQRIMAFGEQLESPKEMIKLLRLCIEHGQDKVSKVLDQNTFNNLSIGVLTSMLSQSNLDIPRQLPCNNGDVHVEAPSLAKYDSLLDRAVAL